MFNLNKTPKSIKNRILQLEAEYAKSEDCQRTDRLSFRISEDIKRFLPEDKAYLVDLLDECNVEMLMLYEEYFYLQGYNDCTKKPRLFEPVLKFSGLGKVRKLKYDSKCGLA